MTKLVKEHVIAQFNAAYQAQHGQLPTLEQNGSWLKINGEQSVRLAGLVQLTAELQQTANAIEPTSAPSPLAKPTKQMAAKTHGLTPNALWRLNIAPGNKLPRGF